MARPKKPPEDRQVMRVDVNLTAAEYSLLSKLAKRDGRYITQQARFLLLKSLADEIETRSQTKCPT